MTPKITMTHEIFEQGTFPARLRFAPAASWTPMWGWRSWVPQRAAYCGIPMMMRCSSGRSHLSSTASFSGGSGRSTQSLPPRSSAGAQMPHTGILYGFWQRLHMADSSLASCSFGSPLYAPSHVAWLPARPLQLHQWFSGGKGRTVRQMTDDRGESGEDLDLDSGCLKERGSSLCNLQVVQDQINSLAFKLFEHGAHVPIFCPWRSLLKGVVGGRQSLLQERSRSSSTDSCPNKRLH